MFKLNLNRVKSVCGFNEKRKFFLFRSMRSTSEVLSFSLKISRSTAQGNSSWRCNSSFSIYGWLDVGSWTAHLKSCVVHSTNLCRYTRSSAVTTLSNRCPFCLSLCPGDRNKTMWRGVTWRRGRPHRMVVHARFRSWCVNLYFPFFISIHFISAVE